MIAISCFWLPGASYLSLVPTCTRDVLAADELVATLNLLITGIIFRQFPEYLHRLTALIRRTDNQGQG